jgi:hypothetical protein
VVAGKRFRRPETDGVAGKRKLLETKLRVLEAKLDMATYPNHDHACPSDAILRDLVGDMDKFHM